MKSNINNFTEKIKNGGLKLKLVLCVCILSLVTVITMALVNFISMSSAINTTIDEMVMPITTETASDISGRIDMLKAQSEVILLRTLASNDIGVKKSTQSYINYQITSTKIGARDYILYKSGELYLCSEGYDSEDICEPIKNTEAYLTSKKKKTSVMTDPVLKADGSGSEFTIIVTSMRNTTGYTLVLFFDVETLGDIVNTINFGETGGAYLINSEGRTVVDRDIENVINQQNYTVMAETDNEYKEIADIHALALAGETGCTSAVIDGVKCEVAYAPIANTEWAAILTAPESEFNSPIKASMNLILIISLIILVISFIVTFVIMTGIVKPIISTTNRLKALSEGDLESPVKLSKEKNEVGVLSASLDETVRSMKMYIGYISDALSNIAAGNLAFEMDQDFKGDFVKIKHSFNAILADLRKTFAQISLASGEVNDGASQVSSGAQLLSSGSSQQSENIRDVYDQIEDIKHKISSNTESAMQTEKLVDEIGVQIDSCNNDMKAMLRSIDDISKSSAQISEIIQVIEDIAFQTNILALNAAVEAARAGDSGKGFAVVADEVRNLANMSADAASQTTRLIEDSLKNVKNGTSVARTAADALNEIIISAADISEKVKSITNDSQAQNDSINEIRKHVKQITDITESNAATAEQSAATAEELSGQSEMLKQMISKFSFEGDFSEPESDEFNSEFNDDLFADLNTAEVFGNPEETEEESGDEESNNTEEAEEPVTEEYSEYEPDGEYMEVPEEETEPTDESEASAENEYEDTDAEDAEEKFIDPGTVRYEEFPTEEDDYSDIEFDPSVIDFKSPDDKY
ncbi:MAG: methyl-accepting chemotaxis protein [Oscillospiraceae bacterium]